MLYDVAVVGDGIAGLVAHFVLQRQRPELRTVLLRAPPRRSKVPKVGEHIPASMQPLLEELGLWESFCRQNYLKVNTYYSVWGSELVQELNAIASNHAGGWSINRRAFEQWLEDQTARLIKSSPKRFVTVRRVEERAGGILELALDQSVKVRARFVIDATGRKALIARKEAYRAKLDKLICAYNYFCQVDKSFEPSVGPLIEACADGWFYSSVLPERRMVVCWFTDADLMTPAKTRVQRNQGWYEQLRTSNVTRRRLESAGYVLDRPEYPNHFYADASTQCMAHLFGRNWVAVGDAAMTFDPLSSHGMVSAVWSGKKAAQAVIDGFDGSSESLADYAQTFLQGFQNYRNDHRRYYGVEKRFDSEFWRRRSRWPV